MTDKPRFGLVVNSIEARAGGGGVVKEFAGGMALEDEISTRQIDQFINENLRLFHSDFVDSSLTYNLTVPGFTELTTNSKARTYVRMMNPFEPDILEVNNRGVEFDLDMPARKGYRIEVTVTK